jgi:uncharacterized FAD-dependent dehydrogenase
MIKRIDIEIDPEKAFDAAHLRQAARDHAGIRPERVTALVLVRRSLDARRKDPIYRMTFDVYVGETPPKHAPHTGRLLRARVDRKVIIVGAGPAGYFAALQLLERGIQPVIFDRGKDVQARRKDLRSIQQFGTVNPDSNYCFGEGGAGTYSDGKLYTAAKKRGNVRKVLELLVEHGAHADILVDAHPHIGSNKLPQIVQAIRRTIEGHGGVVHFASRVTDLVMRGKTVCGVIVNGEQEYLAANVILTTGHSARDMYELLHEKHIRIETKPFAMGIRLEHAQGLIDQMQYHQGTRSRHLPAASYKMVTQVDGRGVFSFCMCPGGLIVPAATAPGEIIVNGMSLSGRDSAFANAGMVVSVERDDVRRRHGSDPLAGLRYQRETEERIFAAGDGSQQAPSQRMIDFVEERLSGSLPATSYVPGLYSAPLHDLLPAPITARLQKAMVLFGSQKAGFLTNDAVVVGVESRTSSPVRIPRQRTSLEHVDIKNLYPCGEGAGYAGGIVSAALDGQNVAMAVGAKMG